MAGMQELEKQYFFNLHQNLAKEKIT